MGDLEVNTPRGQQAEAEAQQAMRAVMACYPGMTYAKTKKSEQAVIDGFIVNGQSEVWCACEVKSRDFTEQTLWGLYRGEWMISRSKFTDMAVICRALHIPGYGVLYMVPSGIVMMVPMVELIGCPSPGIRWANGVRTQANCNGGSKVDNVGYIDMRNAVRIEL